jgi:hypothetical protein
VPGNIVQGGGAGNPKSNESLRSISDKPEPGAKNRSLPSSDRAESRRLVSEEKMEELRRLSGSDRYKPESHEKVDSLRWLALDSAEGANESGSNCDIGSVLLPRTS